MVTHRCRCDCSDVRKRVRDVDQLKPYAEYTSSVEPWLPKRPRHWPMVKLKHALAQRSVKGHPNEPLLAATQTKGVVLKTEYEYRTVEAMKDLHNLKLVVPGDFVISLRSFQGGIEFARCRGIISPAYTILHPRDPSVHGYFAALFKSIPFIGNLTLYVTGIRQGQNVDYAKLSASFVPVPPPEERLAIVRFLATLDRRVNSFVRAKRRLIVLLTEQKHAIITHAVTRGLNPNAELKSSGIDWLGDVPKSWEAKRIKYLLREVNERSADGSEAHLSMSQRHGLIESASMSERRLLSDSYAGGKLCRSGDLVLNRLKAHLGVFAIAPKHGVISPDYTVLRPINGSNVQFLELVLRSNKCRPELRKRAKGIVQGFWRLYTDDLYAIALPTPSPDEQSAIVSECVIRTRGVNDTIEATHREISLIREYRARLVADVVTGKLDVRAAARGLPEQVADPVEAVAEDEIGAEAEDGGEDMAAEEVASTEGV